MPYFRFLAASLVGALALSCSSGARQPGSGSGGAGSPGAAGATGSAGAEGSAGIQGGAGSAGGQGGVGGQAGQSDGGQGGAAAGSGGAPGFGGSGGIVNDSCPLSDHSSWSCSGSDVTQMVSCPVPSSATTKGICPSGCKSAGGFGTFNASLDCNAAPDAGSDAPLGTFVMCDDHADFNGRGRCAATGKVGAVFARQNRTAGGATTSLTAVFGTTTPPWEAGCTREAVGTACTAVLCPRIAPAPVAASAAGLITAKSNGGALVTTPNATGAYDVTQLGRAMWSLPKAALSFSATGGTTAVFGETFCGPPPVAMLKPIGTPGGLTIDRASDLAIQWTPAAVGDLEFSVRDDTSSTTATLEVQCFFTGSAGQGTIPKTALAKLAAGAHTVASTLWVRKIGIGSGGTCSELTAIQTNDSSAGTPFNGTATFQ